MTAWHEPVDVATTEALDAGPAFPASGMIDGIALEAGHRVLVKDQRMPAENGHYVVSGIPPILAPASDAISAEAVTRVNRGSRNAHTAWVLIDTTDRTFVRQDVGHYSLTSIAALKHLRQVLPGATATVAGYAEPGDKGGGDFIFVGMPLSAHIISAEAVTTPIQSLMNVDGAITFVTAAPHGLGVVNNLTSVFISGVAGLADKAYAVRVVDDGNALQTLVIDARIPGASFAPDAKIQYVKLVTAEAHSRVTGQRISVGGVVPSDGAADIRRTIDLSGVVDSTSLSVPIATSAGTYAAGIRAVIGDNGLTVVATDLDGTVGGLWQRLRTDHFDVKWFGARANWDPVERIETDDLPHFVAALASMAAGGRRSGKLVADGHFFLSDTLVLTQTVLMEGTGQNEPERPDPAVTSRCWPGTMLVFPKNVTGIRIRSGAEVDNATRSFGNVFPPTGEKTILRNLTVYCKDGDARAEAGECPDLERPCILEGTCIHGIHASAPVRLENVTVEFFAHDGIHIIGAECGMPRLDPDGNPILKRDENGNLMLDDQGRPTAVKAYDGNADGSHVENCTAGQCGRDGFHFSGGDAQTCVISCCSGVGNGRAGFYDATFGNTYIGCHAAYNAGPNYMTEGVINASVFISCWHEDSGGPSQFRGPVTIISGKIGASYITEDSSAFILEHGVATRAPLVYKNLHSKAAKRIGCSLGSMGQTVQGPAPDMVAFEWATLAADQGADDTMSLRYLDTPTIPSGARGSGWWALEHNDSFYRHMIRFPTARASARLPAPWFVNGMYLGRDDNGPPKVSFTAARTLPRTQDNQDPLTYERGDVVWNSEPLPGDRIGQVCITGGTLSMASGVRIAKAVGVGDTTVEVNRADPLAPGQHITIGGGTDVYTILAVTVSDPPDPAIHPTIGIAPGAIAESPIEAAIEFSSVVAKAVNVGDQTITLDRVDKFAPGQFITIGGGADIYTIARVTVPKPPANPTIDITPAAVAAGGAGIGVGFSRAIFSTFGMVDSPSRSHDGDRLLNRADRYVTVTATSTQMLPANPIDGQTHAIKSAAGVITTVTAEVDLGPPVRTHTIDGRAFVILPPGANGTFRFSAAAGEWEVR